MSWEKYGRNYTRWVAGVFCLWAMVGQLVAADDYRKPNYDSLPFPEGGILMDESKKAGFLNALAAIARNYDDVSNSDRARAVALARRVDPLHKPSFIADYQLDRGVKPEPTADYERKKDAVYAVYKTSLDFLRAPDKKAKEYSGYLIDLLIGVEPQDTNYPALMSEYEKEFPSVSWESIVSIEGDSLAPPPVSLGGPGHQFAFLSTDGILKIQSNSKSGGASGLQFPGRNPVETGIFRSAFREGVKYLGQKKSGITRGWTVSFKADGEFKEEFLEEQGPAAALGSVLSLQALVENGEFDPAIAFAGDVNADGSVQPVHDIRDRLNSIGKSEIKIIGIPMADAGSLGDILILNGPKVFAERQIFGVRSMKEASELSRPFSSRAQDLQAAMDQFSEIQEVLLKPGGMKHLTNSHVLKRLQELTQLAPNHLSAKMLALKGLQRAPGKLTLGASLELVMEPLKSMTGGDDEKMKITSAGLDPEAVLRLQRYAKRIDGRLKKLSSAVVNLSNAGRVGSDKFTAQEIATTWLKDELAAVGRNIDVREEMMR